MSTLAETIGGLVAAYPQARLHEDTPRVYARALADLPADEVAAAARAHVRESRYFPTIAELRERVFLRRLAPPSDVEAWRQVEDRAVETSSLHPLVRAALEYVGGRYAVRTAENPVAVRAQFRDAYRGLVGETLAALSAGDAPPALEQRVAGAPYDAVARDKAEGVVRALTAGENAEEARALAARLEAYDAHARSLEGR